MALIIVAIAAIAVVVFFRDLQHALSRLLEQIAGLGFWGPIVFMLLYIIASVLCLPGFILTLGAGLLWGVVEGVIYVDIAATIGATCAFWIGRYAARDWVTAKLEENPKFQAIDSAIGEEGWKIVLLLRLSPFFPYNILNFALGLTHVSTKHYVLASLVGMLPATVMWVWIGSLAGDLANLSTVARERTVAEWTVYGIGFLATAAVTIYVTRLAQRALRKNLPTSPETPVDS